MIYTYSSLNLTTSITDTSFNFSKDKNMRLYISGQNLFVWTDYPGYDPEVRTYTKNPQKRGFLI